ncbi:XRCC4-like factor-domain-containing protein [Sphaerosporella brunnea]|uniref:Non-homologous end-joining factor 1 n=1 Tax=Sphaerosporella brunnea TaxID=1250544 RepID=A0A5J5F5W1_9PEZI|nr:XRCC4-like factor-domain-containing protein [Sphaerosporella brunnea]
MQNFEGSLLSSPHVILYLTIHVRARHASPPRQQPTMPTAKATSWRPLSLTRDVPTPAPPLLVQTTFTSSSYTVHITDLGQIWSEELSRPGILARAAREDTTIDPSEDSSQFQYLLEKLEESLSPRRRDVAELSLIPGPEGADLRLKLRVTLPSPLPELEWRFELRRGSSVDFANLFVMPLVVGQGVRREMVRSLKETVKQKDAVIERLKDALVENKVRVDVVVGPRRQKALAKFDVDAWEKKLVRGGERGGQDVVKEVFKEGEEEEDEERSSTPAVRPFDQNAAEWWKTLAEQKEKDVEPRRREVVSRQADKIPKAITVSETGDEDDCFERLKTPSPPPTPLKNKKRREPDVSISCTKAEGI